MVGLFFHLKYNSLFPDFELYPNRLSQSRIELYILLPESMNNNYNEHSNNDVYLAILLIQKPHQDWLLPCLSVVYTLWSEKNGLQM